MDYTAHNKIVSFIWSIADDCLRDVYVRGKYRDVILPMFVLRRLDCLLEPSKEAVMEEVKFQRDEVGLTDLEPEGLQEASGYVFYNTSPWTLQKLVDTAANNRQILEANFKAYLDGFSENVKEIVDKFKLRSLARHMAEKDVMLEVLEKFTSPNINLTPNPAKDPDGRKLPPLTNLGMGYVFEELIRKFNEENNEEAGEHFTPREVIDLMTHVLFEPVKDQLPPVITVYDPACGSGGMLTEAQDFIIHPDGLIRANAAVYLYGKEINDETYAICKSDMMIKGNNPEHIKCGSTLATDEFAGMRFDFMLSNPPYGKSWAGDQKNILDGKQVLDCRFEVPLKDFRGIETTVAATPRSSDGQLLFLMEMVSKMKDLDKGPSGSRIGSVHNGSSLFTGDAGGGESNIRRYIIENDYLEAIIQLPNNLFYNTGISTYIWVLSNKKKEERRGKVQLIDASQMFRKLRKNLGAKNCEFSPEHITEITQLYLDMPDDGISKIFANSDFGYFKVTIERPSRKAAQFTSEKIANLRFVPALREVMEWAYEKWGDDVYTKVAEYRKVIEAHLEKEEINLTAKNSKVLFSPQVWDTQRSLMGAAKLLMEFVGQEVFLDFNIFMNEVNACLKSQKIKLSASERNQILNAVSWRDDNAKRVVKKLHKLSGKKLEALLAELDCTQENLHDFGYWPSDTKGNYVEYETDSDLRDNENVPLKDNIHDYFLLEVRPHVEDAWLNLPQTKIGYEISFNKYFYQHKPLRSLEDVTRDILALEAETDGLLKKLVSFGGGALMDQEVGFRRYDSYKDSNADWLGDIPEQWEFERLGTVFKERREKVSDKDFRALSVTKNGVVPQLDSAAKSNDGDNRKGVRKGDFVINSRSDRKGSSGVALEDGSVSLINIVLKPNGIDPRYCEYLLKSNGFIEEFYRHGHGIVADLWTTRYWDMKSIQIPLPDLQTQQRIANFLQQKTTDIDEAIIKKQRLIELLKEEKAILINQAVTKGLSSRVKIVPTGNAFFPEIPENRPLVKLGYLCNKVADGPHFSPTYVEDGVDFLSAGNIRVDRWLLDDVKQVSERDYLEFCKRIIPEVGDVLYTKGGTTGVAKVVDLTERFQVWVHVAVLKIRKDKINPYYLAYALNSIKCYEQSQLFTRGATNKDLGLTRMVNIVLPLPSLEEQTQIVSYLDKISNECSNLNDLTLEQIRHLIDFKSVLISNAVTGKIKI